jgi:hypothetical protein
MQRSAPLQDRLEVDNLWPNSGVERMNICFKAVKLYSTIPQIWPLLFAHLKELNEIPKYPNLEIYGHWNAGPSKCETTILIGLDQKQ